MDLVGAARVGLPLDGLEADEAAVRRECANVRSLV